MALPWNYADLFMDADEELDYSPDTPPSPPNPNELEHELPRDMDEEDGRNCHIEKTLKDLGDGEIDHKPSDDHIIPSMLNEGEEPRRLDDGEHSRGLSDFMEQNSQTSQTSQTPSIGPLPMGMGGLDETPPPRLQPRTSWRDYTTLQVAAEPQGIFRHPNRPGVGPDSRDKGDPLFRRYKGAPGEIRGRSQPSSTVTSSQRNDKLKQGLRSLAKTDYPSFGSIAASSALANTETPVDSNVPAWEPDPWQCVKRLMKQGYEIQWTMFKLKNPNMKNQTHVEREYKCFIKHKQHTGVCEARREYLAKLGAASELLQKLRKRMPQVGDLNTEIASANLVSPLICRELMGRLKEKSGFAPYYKIDCVTFPVNSSIIKKCEIRIGPEVYSDYSYSNIMMAKMGAWKQAYEALLMEPYPLQKIFIGKDCIMDVSLYTGIQSEMTHLYDSTHAPVLPPESMSRNSMASNRQPVHVSHGDAGKETNGEGEGNDEKVSSAE